MERAEAKAVGKVEGIKMKNNFSIERNCKMKKLLILCVLLLSTFIYSQNPIEIGDNGTVWNDSLYCGGTATGDSVYIINFNMEYEWVKIFLEGDTNSSVDTVALREGTNVYSNLTGYPTNTYIWGSLATLRDSSDAKSTIMVNNSTGKSFTLWDPPMTVYKLYFLNYWGTLTTRNCTFSIVAKKKAK